MDLNNQDILFASLMGTRILEQTGRLGIIQNELVKQVLPTIPFLSIKTNTDNLWKASKNKEVDQFYPLTFSLEGVKTAEGKEIEFKFPYEPIINISGKNNIIKRNVAKQGDSMIGSIKERWSQDDYKITITGVLIGNTEQGNYVECFPKSDFEKLKIFLTAAKTIKVHCEPLQLLEINHIVIKDFSFPFTTGENVQAYEIKAVSDFSYNLLNKIENK